MCLIACHLKLYLIEDYYWYYSEFNLAASYDRLCV